MNNPNTNRRRLVKLALSALPLTVASWSGLHPRAARAQELPTGPIRVIVPFIAGSSIDARMRVLAQAIGERLNLQLIVENRTGAGGSLGAAMVARAPADGTTWLFTNNSYAIDPYVYKDAGYDPLTSLVPLNGGYVSALAVLVDPNLKVNTLSELVALAKSKPDLISYGSSGVGSLPHFAAEMFFHMAGIKALHIPMKGDAQVLNEILGGRVSMLFGGLATAQPHIRSGAVKALAITSPTRNARLPDVPTMAEAGFPEYKDSTWAGFFLPAATPGKMVEALNREITAALSMPLVKARLEETGAEPAPMGVEEFKRFVRGELKRYAKLVENVGVKLD